MIFTNKPFKPVSCTITYSLKVYNILDHNKCIGVVIVSACFHGETDCLSLMYEYNPSSSVFKVKHHPCGMYGQLVDSFNISSLYEKTSS